MKTRAPTRVRQTHSFIDPFSPTYLVTYDWGSWLLLNHPRVGRVEEGLVRAGVVSWKMGRARPPGHYARAGLLQGVMRDSLLFPFLLPRRHFYDEQLSAFSLPRLQEGLPVGNQGSHHSFVNPGTDGLSPLRPKVPALRPVLSERVTQPGCRPVAFRTYSESSFPNSLFVTQSGGDVCRKRAGHVGTGPGWRTPSS